MSCLSMSCHLWTCISILALVSGSEDRSFVALPTILVREVPVVQSRGVSDDYMYVVVFSVIIAGLMQLLFSLGRVGYLRH
jgi:hypothetical protein